MAALNGTMRTYRHSAAKRININNFQHIVLILSLAVLSTVDNIYSLLMNNSFHSSFRLKNIYTIAYLSNKILNLNLNQAICVTHTARVIF